jgi:hypothetical protein
VNWREILEKAGIPEPPGRDAVLAQIKAKPYLKLGKKVK